jgi:uncharacterized membrane protein
MTKFAFVFSILAACTASNSSTGASCPTANPPTYATFGQRFFANYCTGCHSAVARDRYGAPPGLDFDSEAEIRAHAAAIDATSATGPRGDNIDMPDTTGPVLVPPTHEERATLAQWLACEQAAP